MTESDSISKSEHRHLHNNGEGIENKIFKICGHKYITHKPKKFTLNWIPLAVNPYIAEHF